VGKGIEPGKYVHGPQKPLNIRNLTIKRAGRYYLILFGGKREKGEILVKRQKILKKLRSTTE
jgi:hypothetical protein